ncbi:hypothetical protein Daus18300_002294 [Diaporthe australafricana]|uniref:NTF2-like domain-containing protein n=1 Tax=Diaporthe australafricana TaxID=127596 RepID=A0ABR3XQD3_9PEZI
MHFSLPFVITLAAGALAQGRWSGPPHPPFCLNDTSVATLVDGYTYLLEKPLGPDFNSTAEAILSDKFQVFSDSILTLSQRPFGQPAYPSKQAYIDSQAQTPPLPVVTTLGTFYTCDKISWRWQATGIGSNQFEINGIINFETNPQTVQIDTVYSEFNTGAFQADLGFPECQQS